MTVVDGWELISSGGATAVLFLVLVLVLTERLVTGTQFRRECDRNRKLDEQNAALNAQNHETVLIAKRMLDVIDQYTRSGGVR